jgi:hypothetical protein
MENGPQTLRQQREALTKTKEYFAMAAFDYSSIPSHAIERFWRGVAVRQPEECWPWMKSVNKNGYGKISVSIDGRKWHLTAHRIATYLAKGPPLPGMHALHSCDNPPCCNPDHLRWGTGMENISDAIERGLLKRGIENPAARLTDELVRDIRVLHRYGAGARVLGRTFGINHQTIRDIVRGHIWRHVA